MAIAFSVFTSGFAADAPITAYVSFTVLERGAGGHTVPFELSTKAAPKRGNRLQVWLSADDACSALVVAFNKSGQLAWPDEPLLVSLPAHNEQQLPSAGEWKWEMPGAVTEFDVVLVDLRSPALPQLTQLIEAMHAPAQPPIRVRQIAELRRTIDSMTQRAAAADYSMKTEPVSLAGLLRGMGCDWCKDAQKISVPRSGSYLVRQRFP